MDNLLRRHYQYISIQQLISQNSQTNCTYELIIVLKACANPSTQFGTNDYREGMRISSQTAPIIL